METKEIVTRTSTIHIEANGIVRVTIMPGMVQTLEDAKENAVAIDKLVQSQDFLALIDLRYMKSQDREAREFYTQPGHKPRLIAVALLIGSPMSRVIGNLYMGFNKSDISARLFTSETEAFKWLETFAVTSTNQDYSH